MIAWRTWPWWCKLLAIGGAVIAITVVSFATWFFSDADLRRVEERAKAMGVATTWEEFGVEDPPQDYLRAWDDFVARTKGMKSWVDTQGIGQVRLPVIGEDPPQSLIDHAQAVAKTLGEAIDALPPHRVIPDGDGDGNTTRSQPGLTVIKKPFDLQREVVMTCADGELRQAVQRLYNLASSQPLPPTLIGHLLRLSYASRLLSATTFRHRDLDQETRKDLALRLDDLSDQIATLELQALRGEWVVITRNITNPHWVESMVFFSGTGSASEPKWLDPVFFRCGRSLLLEHHLDLIVALETGADPKINRPIANALATKVEAIPAWSPSGKMTKAVFPAFMMVLPKSNMLRSQLNLCAHLLRGNDTGIDPTCGEAYRRYKRDGEPVGWYSPGFDGDDGGNERKDWCLAWEQPWRVPTRPILSPATGSMMPPDPSLPQSLSAGMPE